MDFSSLSQAIGQLSLVEPVVPDSTQEVASEGDEAPYFFPPLWLARRSKIVGILKEEQVGSVCDLGCGSGSVLQILASPANHLDDFPSIYPPSPVSKSPQEDSQTILPESPKERKRNLLRSIPSRPRSEGELHLRRLVGIDVDKEALESSIRITEPPVIREVGSDSWSSNNNSYERERWEELRVEIYHGAAFEVYNEALSTGLDAMFSTEVLEHLSPTSVNKFTEIVLGVYQPRVFIVTTPNHEFNPYFLSSSTSSSPSSTLEESAHRFPDPTLRTKRVFRDADHQFEWTQSEFESWANTAAEEHDYLVSFTGVGSLTNYFGYEKPIPFPPPSLQYHPQLRNELSSIRVPSDPSQFFATQIAIFTKRFSQEAERTPRSHRATPLPFFSPPGTPTITSTSDLILPPSTILPNSSTPPQVNGHSPISQKSHRLTSSLSLTPHTHLKTHIHPKSPQASEPLPSKEILKIMKSLCQDFFRLGRVSLRDYWNRKELREACGGTIGVIVEAVLVSDELGEGEENRETEGEDEWDFYLIQGRDGRVLRGDEALGIFWKNFTPTHNDEEGVKSFDSDSKQEEEEESEESDEDWRAQASDFLVDDFDAVEERQSWGNMIAELVPKVPEVKTSDTW